MKSIKLLAVLVSILLSTCSMQGQKMIWTALNGGENSNGAVVAYDLTYNQSQALASLDGNPLGSYEIILDLNLFNSTIFNSNGLIYGTDGKLYGTTSSMNMNSSLDAYGGIYSIDPISGDLEVLFSFVGNHTNRPIRNSNIYDCYNRDLRQPVFGLIEASPGVFYGIAWEGGDYNLGGIYKFETATSTYTKIHSFDDLASGGIGRIPNSPLIIGPNGDLFGVLEAKGPVGSANLEGHLYKVDVNTDVVSYVKSLSSTTAGWAISGAVDQICYNSSLNKIFGTKETFAGANYGGGVYSYDFASGVVTDESSILIGQVTTLGSNANGMTPIANDGNHYFVCRNGGSGGNGTLVKYSPAGNTMVKVHDFSYPPNGTGLKISGTKIYGTYNTVSPNEPILWSYDVSTSIHNNVLTGTNDSTLGHLMEHSFAVGPTHIYGRNSWGGNTNSGAIFKYDKSTGQHSVLKKGESAQGRGLVGEIKLVNDTLAYTFIQSGTNRRTSEFSEIGGIAKINLVDKTVEFDTVINSSQFTKSRSFHYNRPHISSGNKMYFTSEFQNYFGSNTNLQQIDVNTGNRVLLHFSDPVQVNYSVLEYKPGKMLFATNDSIYVYDETTQTKTAYFSGLSSHNGLMMNNLYQASNGLIFGTTAAASISDTTKKCIIYSIDTSNFAVNVEYVFDRPVIELNNGLQELNGKLYGSTTAGGANNEGYLFSHDLSTNTTAIEYSFDYAADGGVFLGEWTPYNGELYAVSYTGGTKGFGTFVKYNPSTGAFTVIEHLDRNKGRAFRSSPVLWDDSFTSIEENELLKRFKLYPNPGDGTINIENLDLENSKIEVYNLSGLLLKSVVRSNTANVQHLNPGIYLVKVQEGKNIQTFKYIKR